MGSDLSFQGLGFFSDWSDNYGGVISQDASTVVGNSTSPYAPFRWTSESGILPLTYLASATDVSSDGSLVVGRRPPSTNSFGEAARWTLEEGVIGLGYIDDVTPLGRGNSSAASGVSADGRVIVGSSNAIAPSGNITREAFRWAAETGMVGLGFLAGTDGSNAEAVSLDGTVVVGTSSQSSSDYSHEAFRWTMESGMSGLGYLPGREYSTAFDTSADGSAVVGESWRWGPDPNSQLVEAFHWTEATGMIGLGFLPDKSTSRAYGVSDDGSLVVGESYNWTYRPEFGNYWQTDNEAFLWTNDTGILSVHNLLRASGLPEVEGWKIQSAVSIAGDGRTFAGRGIDPDGRYQSWIATIELPVVGDANLDRRIDGADYTIWADNFQSGLSVWERGDFNADGKVDGADYTLWADHFQSNANGGSVALAVPECGTDLLALAGLPLIFWILGRSRMLNLSSQQR